MKFKIKGQELIITINYLDRREPYIPKRRPLEPIPTSETTQGMRTDFAYGIVHKLEKALKMSQK